MLRIESLIKKRSGEKQKKTKTKRAELAYNRRRKKKSCFLCDGTVYLSLLDEFRQGSRSQRGWRVITEELI